MVFQPTRTTGPIDKVSKATHWSSELKQGVKKDFLTKDRPYLTAVKQLPNLTAL